MPEFLTLLPPDEARSLLLSHLPHLERQPIGYPAAVRQHAAYEACLEALGYLVQQLPGDPGLPNSVFIEDTALVLDEAAVITRPGAESRRSETAAVAEALAAYRSLHFIEPPGTLDGGDILRLGKRLYVGLSGRSNAEGIRQLSNLLGPLGYTVQGVPLSDCLHLKSAVTHGRRRHSAGQSAHAGWRALDPHINIMSLPDQT